jgi:sortase A
MRRVAAATGRGMIVAGILILLFVGYQLWGTGIYEHQQQSRLRDEFNAQLHRLRATSPVLTTPVPAPPAGEPPEGSAIGRMQIPKIGLDTIVVEGVGVDDLRKGPGHYPITPLPGERGNAAIAGHRTTYGHPFGDIDHLAAGDLIRVQTLQGSFRYRVYQKLTVDPGDVGVLKPDPARPATLTLTTCNPKYSAAQRLIVQAELIGAPLPAPPLPVAKLREPGLSGDQASRLPAVLAGLVVAAVGGLWWLGFHRRPRWYTWLVGAVPFAVALFYFYSYIERVLPANY